MQTLTHRRQTASLLQGHVCLFAERGNANYGLHTWRLDTDLADVPAEVVAFAAEYYGCSLEQAERECNPASIVDSAGVWDDAQFVSDLWQAMEAGLVAMAAGFRTPDGAVVIDRESAEITYLGEIEE